MPIFAIPNETNTVSKHAEVAQLVEHNLAKVGVASSSLVFRSKGSHFVDLFFVVRSAWVNRKILFLSIVKIGIIGTCLYL